MVSNSEKVDRGGLDYSVRSISVGHDKPYRAGDGVVIGGDPTSLVTVPDVDASTDAILAAHTTQTMTHSIRFVSADGTEYFIMCTDADTNRTES